MATDLQGDTKRLYRLLEKYQKESTAVIIASVSLIVSVLSLFLMVTAVIIAINANSKVTSQNERLAEMSRHIETQDAKMYAHTQKDH